MLDAGRNPRSTLSAALPVLSFRVVVLRGRTHTLCAYEHSGGECPRSRRLWRLPRVSVVIPCLNEAENIDPCVAAARAAFDGNGIRAR